MTVDLTDHARDRWHRRSSTPSLDPLVAWINGKPVDGTNLDGDEIRYHEPSDTLLVRKDVAIVTVVDAATASQPTRDAIDAVNRGETA